MALRAVPAQRSGLGVPGMDHDVVRAVLDLGDLVQRAVLGRARMHDEVTDLNVSRAGRRRQILSVMHDAAPGRQPERQVCTRHESGAARRAGAGRTCFRPLGWRRVDFDRLQCPDHSGSRPSRISR